MRIPLYLALILSVFTLSPVFSVSSDPIDGTTGAPLGGIGSGGIKFSAHSGKFFLASLTPCALENFVPLANTQFQWYSKRTDAPVTREKLTSTITNGRSADDAAYPVHLANFGTIDGVTASLTACSPIDLNNLAFSSSPCALYEFDLVNTGSGAVDVAMALQFSTGTAPVYVAGKGLKNEIGNLKQAVYAASDNASAEITTGNDAGFFSSGTCNNTPSGLVNRVAVKVRLDAGGKASIRFVYAWYRNATGKEGLPRFYYYNRYPDVASVADSGLAAFVSVRTNLVTLVNRLRASTVPSWIKNQAIATLSTLTNNTMYTKDERVAFTEGQWSTNGTMDQMWHSRQIFIQMLPSLMWQEMKYWASTQKTSPAGQIHHDLGEQYDMSYMCPWDDKQHADYRDIDKWVDLNCAFIISLYELFIATDDTTQLNYFWPYIKKAGQRVLDMVRDYGSTQYPYTFDGTENSYDAGGDPNPYNTSITPPTYKILSILAGIKGETALKQTYDQAFTTVVENIKKRYLTATTAYPWNRISESMATGPWIMYYLKLGDLLDSASLAFMLNKLNAYYEPLSGLGYNSGTYNEWAPYIIGHYAGLCLATGKYDVWKGMQFDWYERIFLNRDRVFNQELGIPSKVSTPKYLATDSSGYIHYLSVPVVWRNYYTLVGFHRNKHTGELWLEPMLPPEMNHTMQNALVFTPETWATVSCTESGASFKTKKITFLPDKPMAVDKIYVTDPGSATLNIMVNGEIMEASKFSRLPGAYQRKVQINWKGTVGPEGLNITVSDEPIAVKFGKNSRIGEIPCIVASTNGLTISTLSGKPHEISFVSMSGKTRQSIKGFGSQVYRFGARENRHDALQSGVYLVVVRSGTSIYSRQVILTR